jgi:hypothetical protein
MNFKKKNFLLLWVIFVFLDPDLIRIRIRIRNPAVARGLVPGHELVVVNSDEGLGAGPGAPGLPQAHSLPRSELRL